jgi:signal transduction histidine kinase
VPVKVNSRGEQMTAHGRIPHHSTAPAKSVRDGAILVLALALDVLLFSDVGATSPLEAGGPRTPVTVVILIAVISLALLLVRRRAGMPILIALCLVSVLGSTLTSYRPIIGVCIALAGMIAYGSIRRGVIAFLVALVPVAAWVYGEDRQHNWSMTAPVLFVIGIGYLAVLVVSAGIGGWRRTVERLHETRRAEAERAAVRGERQRVARELHDIVAHAVTLMVLQAAGAGAVLRTDPDRAEAALGVVERTGSEAMTELRRLLAVLRAPDDGMPDEVEPPPGLRDVPGLVQSIRAAGVLAAITVDGTPRPINRSIDAAAYRVISESLTNVSKHAGAGSAAQVRVSWSDTLDIEVADDGRGRGPVRNLSTGNGLIGLAERVDLLGGTFSASPKASGGFRVHAVIPLPTAESSPTPIDQIAAAYIAASGR